ncbi:Aspartic proteinase Asp1 [Triticum urartu]|uniref:Aspartic proteinase Asp1 n=1 Tax=Triticum urartu TaxID=4572 RepID=M7ZM89_TRIUA|nr:Aspartic proteinase Asp1 [Triticum urartu]
MAAMWCPIIGLLLLLPLGPSSAIKFPLIGNIYPDGHFYATLQIGKPLKPYFLDIDTGSNLTWLECKHPDHGCNGCNQRTPHPYYKPAAHNLMVRCESWICAQLRKDQPGSPPCPNSDPHRCHYDIQYVSGRGSVGFVAQLKAQEKIVRNVIGHCLSIHGNGNLYIGDFRLPPGDVTWAPMSTSLPYYSPGPATLLFDEQPIRGSPAFTTVFDSGATYTYMPGQIYNGLVSKVQDTLHKSSLKEVKDRALPQCWKGKMPFRSVDDVKNEFKPLSLKLTHARGTSSLDIPPENYLIVTKDGNACLAILDGSSDRVLRHLILIGDVTMQDLFVIYDNEVNRLGWVRAQCDRMQDLESVIIGSRL